MNKRIACMVTSGEVVWPFEAEDLLSSMRENLSQPLRRACKNGACGICRCKLVVGQVDYGARQPFALWSEEIERGYILPCIAKPLTDIELTEISYEPAQRKPRSAGLKIK